MGVSKVDFGNETLIDLTNDTVNENNLLAGATAHGANGEPITGSVVTHEYTAGDGIDITNNVISTETRIIDITQAAYDALTQEEKMDPSIYYNIKDASVIGGVDVIDNLTSSDSTKALSANQGKILKETIEGVSGGDEWLSNKAYSIDDYVIYQNKLYQCIANTTAGIAPTNTTYWKPISIKDINTNLGNVYLTGQRETIYDEKSSTTNKTFNYVMPKNGYIVVQMSTDSIVSYPFMRINLNGNTIHEFSKLGHVGSSDVTDNYLYRWSPIIPVAKGVTVTVTWGFNNVANGICKIFLLN